jgi:hypothetical protein
MRWIALLAVVLAGDAFAQACVEPPTGAQPRDSAILTWPAVTTWLVDGMAVPLPSDVTMTYVVLEVVGGVETRRCTTTGLTAYLAGLAIGTHTWLVRSATASSEPAWVWSRSASPTWSKTIVAPAPVVVSRLPIAPASLSGN